MTNADAKDHVERNHKSAICHRSVAAATSPISHISGGPPPIDRQDRSVDVARFRRNQEEHRISDFPGFGRASQWNMGQQARGVLRVDPLAP